jgi:hypothetical protein
MLTSSIDDTSGVLMGTNEMSHHSDDSNVSSSASMMDTSSSYEEEDERESDSMMNSSKGNKKKSSVIVKILLFGILFVLGSLIVDYYLYLKMEFTAKTVDVVLSEDSPDADIKLSLDVSSRLLFSSIDVK